LAELTAATLKRRRKRGRPKGSGRKHPEKRTPKTFRHFSALSHKLLFLIRITNDDLKKQSGDQIVEEALKRYAHALSNENPLLAKRLRLEDEIESQKLQADKL
jgi:hypothetical protein